MHNNDHGKCNSEVVGKIRCFKLPTHIVDLEAEFLKSRGFEDLNKALDVTFTGIDVLVWALRQIDPYQEDGAMRAVRIADIFEPYMYNLEKICTILADYTEIAELKAA